MTLPAPALAAIRIPESVDRLFAVLMALSGLMVLLLVVLGATFCIRYRAGSRAERPPGTMPVSWIETTWISITLLVFLGIGVWANIDFYHTRTAPPDSYMVYVTGKQWMWKIEHPSGRREIDELHVPTGQPIRLVLSSDDVIHSFYVPDFRVKQDAVPGRYTSMWFQAESPGTHELFCAEYCGTEHSGMIGRVVAMDPQDFSRWLGAQSNDAKQPGMPGTPQAPLATGRELFFRLGCANCHVKTGSIIAPRLDGLWERPTKLNNGDTVLVDENYIRESVLDPNAKIAAGYASPSLMPSFIGAVHDDEMRQLIEFIRSIRHGWPKDDPYQPEPLPAPPANRQPPDSPTTTNQPDGAP